MKCTSLRYQSLEHLEQHINREKLVGKNLLIFVFTNSVFEGERLVDSEIEQACVLHREILHRLPGATLLGCSSAGAFAAGNVVEEGTVITFCQFRDIHFRGACYSLEEYSPVSMARCIKKDLVREDARLLFLITDGLQIRAHELLEELASQVPHLPIAGGRAGDDIRFERTFVFYNDKVLAEGAAAVTLHGPFLKVHQFHRLDWKKIGKKMIVTEAQGNCVKSLDGSPPKEVYRRYLGSEIADNLLHSAGVEFPLILNRHGLDVARVICGQKEDGSILYFGDIFSGEEVRFGYGSMDTLFKSPETEYRELRKDSWEGAFVFSCVVRKNMLQERAADQLMSLQRFAPVTGFFSYGEFLSFQGKNYLLNATMAVTMLSESKEVLAFSPEEEKRAPWIPGRDRRLGIIKALTHLTDTVTSELEATNRKLKEKNRLLHEMVKNDGLTKLYNHKYFYEKLEKRIENALQYQRDLSIAIIDVDNFKEINDTWGHPMGDKVLVALGESIRKNCRVGDVAGRCGGDEFAVIFPETDLSEAAAVAERIRSDVESLVFKNDKIHITVSIGVAQLDCNQSEMLVPVADKRLYQAKLRGRNTVVTDDVVLL